MVASAPEELLGSIVDGRYALTSLLGRGGYGAVFRAEDEAGAPCAVKLIPFERSNGRGQALREAGLMREHAQHPSLVAFRDAGRFGPTAQGFVYIAMELGDGSLHDHVQRKGPLAPVIVRGIVLDLLDALDHLHGRGVVHRDVKPANLVRAGGRYKLCDLGAARAVDDASGPRVINSGTPEYMAPEAFAGEDTAASDLWSAGVLLHEAATGKLPFDVKGRETKEIARIVREAEPRVDPSLPAPLAAVVRGCLTRDPARRFTTRDVREALSGDLALMPVRTRRLPGLAIAFMMFGLALLALACDQLAR